MKSEWAVMMGLLVGTIAGAGAMLGLTQWWGTTSKKADRPEQAIFYLVMHGSEDCPYRSSEPQLRSDWLKGRLLSLAGTPVEACPYSPTQTHQEQRKAWMEGWTAGFAEKRLKE